MHFRTRDHEDIEQALRSHAAQVRAPERPGQAHLELSGHGVPLPSDVQVQVLHVVQEALSNVRKHAAGRGAL